MSLKIIDGNIFTSQCQTLVNTVNCVGVMGAGIALEFKYRHPKMFTKYQQICNNQQLDIGQLWLYKPESEIDASQWVLNFPTKKDWKYPSKKAYLEQGLARFVETYKSKAITSIAFPLLGADKGGISQDESITIMKKHLEDLDIQVELYLYSPKSKDDLIAKLKESFDTNSQDCLVEQIKIKKQTVLELKKILSNDKINQINQLNKLKGLGTKSLEKLYQYALDLKHTPVMSKVKNMDEMEQAELF